MDNSEIIAAAAEYLAYDAALNNVDIEIAAQVFIREQGQEYGDCISVHIDAIIEQAREFSERNGLTLQAGEEVSTSILSMTDSAAPEVEKPVRPPQEVCLASPVKRPRNANIALSAVQYVPEPSNPFAHANLTSTDGTKSLPDAHTDKNVNEGSLMNPKMGQYMILIAIAFAILMLGTRLSTLHFGRILSDQGTTDRAKIAELEARLEEIKANDQKMRQAEEQITKLKESNAQLRAKIATTEDMPSRVIHQRIDAPEMKRMEIPHARIIRASPVLREPSPGEIAQAVADAAKNRKPLPGEATTEDFNAAAQQAGEIAQHNRNASLARFEEARRNIRALQQEQDAGAKSEPPKSDPTNSQNIVRRGDPESLVREVFGRPKSVRNYSYFEVWDYGDLKSVTIKNGIVDSWRDMPVEP